jgi:hypothetical protein
MRVRKASGDIMPMLVLDRICGRGQSNHVTISISGFLSQDSEKGKLWEGLAEYLQHKSPEMFDP